MKTTIATLFAILFTASLYGQCATVIYSTMSVAGYETENARPAGPMLTAGFLLRDGALGLTGSGGYNSYSTEGRADRMYFVQGGLGLFVTDKLFTGINVAYFGERNGSDGSFGFNAKTMAGIYRHGNLSVIASAEFGFADNFNYFAGGLGLSYQIQ